MAHFAGLKPALAAGSGSVLGAEAGDGHEGPSGPDLVGQPIPATLMQRPKHSNDHDEHFGSPELPRDGAPKKATSTLTLAMNSIGTGRISGDDRDGQDRREVLRVQSPSCIRKMMMVFQTGSQPLDGGQPGPEVFINGTDGDRTIDATVSNPFPASGSASVAPNHLVIPEPQKSGLTPGQLRCDDA